MCVTLVCAFCCGPLLTPIQTTWPAKKKRTNICKKKWKPPCTTSKTCKITYRPVFSFPRPVLANFLFLIKKKLSNIILLLLFNLLNNFFFFYLHSLNFMFVLTFPHSVLTSLLHRFDHTLFFFFTNNIIYLLICIIMHANYFLYLSSIRLLWRR